MISWGRHGRTAATFGTGIVGGLIFHVLQLPLAWMLGPLVSVAAAGLLGMRTSVPKPSRQYGQAIAGVAVGLYFTPGLVAELLPNLPAIALVSLLSILFSGVVSWAIARLTGIDGTTSFFASLPGGVAEMSVLAERYGGDTAIVALTQSLRIVIVVLSIPPLVFYLGRPGTLDWVAASMPLNIPAMIAMFAVAAFLAWLLGLRRIPNNWLLGGILVGACTAYFRLPLSSIPTPVSDLSQLLIGTALGARFTAETVHKLRRFIPASIASTVVILLFNALLSLILTVFMSDSLETLVLANAPGGVAETSLTAKALHLGVATVTSFHLVRILFIVLLSAPLYETAVRIGLLGRVRQVDA
ncbi:AbrB family transcriptional regulator [Roseomonas elaeocarpi]|uniref:AbrB family transcriptional regulator n=1 Tax=Roseomonas elaeocarpi TaxID=907779 RepID=A0ABV6JMZ4_9PROT